MPNPRHTNRLASETSPYLLQHAHNPVDWYPWGEEAFAAARLRNVPIFLSVGYSTCYWCHVMERQSFENEAVAAVMNEKFVNIKVDREERPDVDQLFMTAVQVLTQHGGWPMSAFLTPDLRPFYGGTYFPPTDAHGRPGFVTILNSISDAFRDRKNDVEQSASQITDILKQLAEPDRPARTITFDGKWIDSLVVRSTGDYEPTFGGFGRAPKFPRETLLELLLSRQRSNPHAGQMKQLLHTLDAMAAGGIRDQLGGGFHRYSTDARWLVPHFEIMLYDNALLAGVYVEAYAQTEDPHYAEIARGIFDFVLREMTSPAGGFFTAIDAEVDGQEGLNYLWTAPEIEAVLGDDAALFSEVYGVDRGPNFADPHHGDGSPTASILYVADFDLLEQNATRLAEMRAKLKAVRDARKQPLTDTKILTSWNALMIQALATGGRVLEEPRYIKAAERAAAYLVKTHSTAEGALWRTSRDGATKHAGFLDDYAFLTQAFLALHDAGADERWRDSAHALSVVMCRKFLDADRGGFFFTEAGATDLVVRQKAATDSPLPSGNATAVLTMIEFGEQAVARKALEAFAKQLDSNAEGMSSLVRAAGEYVARFGPFTVSGGGEPNAHADVVQIDSAWPNPKTLFVQIQIAKGHHIQAHDAGAGLVATELFAPAGARVIYPHGEMIHFPFAGDAVSVYSGTVAIEVRFDEPPAFPFEMNLRFQSCDESACAAPVTRVLRLTADWRPRRR